MLRSLECAGAPDCALAPLRKVQAAAKVRGVEYFNVPQLFLRATEEVLEAHTESLDALNDAGLEWDGLKGDKGAATRFRACAELCAREERHQVAAKLLIRAVEVGGASREDKDLLEEKCKLQQFVPNRNEWNSM
jgi:hypothetical protein